MFGLKIEVTRGLAPTAHKSLNPILKPLLVDHLKVCQGSDYSEPLQLKLTGVWQLLSSVELTRTILAQDLILDSVLRFGN